MVWSASTKKISFLPRDSSKHQQRIAKGKATKAVRSNAFSQRVVNDWNSLPENVIKAESLNIFKNRLDDVWSDKMFTTLDD